jgi:hypothetical protein
VGNENKQNWRPQNETLAGLGGAGILGKHAGGVMARTFRPDLKLLLRALANEVINGTAHLRIVTGLRDADPVVLGTASYFFGLTIRAHLEAAQMYAAKLFDISRGAETIHTLVAAAEQNTQLFGNGNPREVDMAVRAACQRIKRLDPVMRAVRSRRNKVLAHLAPETVRDPVKVARDARLTLKDLSKILDTAGRIVNLISMLYSNEAHLIRFPFDDDYKLVLERITESECSRIRKYENEGKAKWVGARPKSCSPN